MDDRVYAALFTLLAIVIIRLFRSNSRLPYPPGPKGLPLIGNIFDIPPLQEWLTYAKWSHEFSSDLIYLNLAGTHLIVVNSYETALELFERRSSIYSDRPRLPMLSELMGWEIALTFMHYGSEWRRHRRMLHRYFNISAVKEFRPKEVQGVHELLHRLVHKPKYFMESIHLLTTSVSLDIAYGMDVQSHEDPLVVIAAKAAEALTVAGNPGAFLVDNIPMLKYVPEWFPGAGFQKTAKDYRKCVDATADTIFKVKENMTSGTYRNSVTSRYLESLDEAHDKASEEYAIRGLGATIYTAGADTTASSLCSFILAMVLYPEVFQRAREEVDRVVGLNRLPDFEDRASLPYISAIVKESLRWNPVAPLGVAHRLTVDDVYDGIYLPAGAVVLGNSWAILHDEREYPNPLIFNPDRFLMDGQLNPQVREPDAAFGFGRRSCPGRHLALDTIFLTVASIVTIFNIGKAVDDNGKEITPSEDYDSGLLVHPRQFKCSMEPRSPQAARLVAEAYMLYHPH